MEEQHLQSAASMRSLLTHGRATPIQFREALANTPTAEREIWLDRVLGLGEIPEDGPDLPRGCVPYLPCPVDTLRRMIDLAGLCESDVFVDIGAGVGRTAAIIRFLTGASVIGLEIQAGLAGCFRELARSLNASRMTVVEGDAAELAEDITTGTVFFLYCPFSGARLKKVMDGLERIAERRRIRVCTVNLDLPSCSWLTLVAPRSGELAVYASVPGD